MLLRTIRSSVRSVLAPALLLATALAAPAGGAERAREKAGDFPPGSFSDGGRYRLSDFEGKAVVLFFYEKDCPGCRGKIPERNRVVDQFKDKPVKFFAIAPGDTLVDVNSYVRGTRLKMTTFSDLFGVMQARYGMEISLQNIYQFRVIGPDGTVVARNSNMNPADIEKALTNAKWKYKDGGYHAGLNPIIDLLEWNQYEPALRQLKPAAKAGNKAIQESAGKLLEAVRAEAKGWLAEAAKASETDPVRAHDLYARVAACFAGEDLGKQADGALKTLATNKVVVAELAARKMYDGIAAASAKAQKGQKAQFVTQATTIAKKYPDAPTGKLAATLAEDLAQASAQ